MFEGVRPAELADRVLAQADAIRADLVVLRCHRPQMLRERVFGDISKAMSHRAHYHEVGLLEPAAIDPYSGYRFYEPAQVPIAQVVRRFRDLGMPLDEVRSVLSAPDVAARNRVIVAHLGRIESEVARTQATVASLRWMPCPLTLADLFLGDDRAGADSVRLGLGALPARLVKVYYGEQTRIVNQLGLSAATDTSSSPATARACSGLTHA